MEKGPHMNLEVPLSVIAQKLVDDGNADRFIEMMNYLAGAVYANYGKQHSDAGQRFDVFFSRVKGEFSPMTKQFVTSMIEMIG